MSLQKTFVNKFFLIKPQKRQITLSNFSFAAIGIMLGLISFIPYSSNFVFYAIKLFQLLLFFAFGNVYVLQRQIFLNQKDSVKPRNYMLPVAISLCIILSGLYLLFSRQMWMMAFSSMAAFMLPFFLKLCWSLFTAIPEKKYDTWIPRKGVSDRASIFIDSLSVKLKLCRHLLDVPDKVYKVHAPHYIKLGDFFSHFLTEQNRNPDTSVEDTDDNENKYAWEFFATDLYGLQLRRLDPYLTLVENKIRKGAVIYLRRITQSVKLLSYTKNLINETVE